MKPLDGVRVVELASIGPGTHAGMLLSDMGADVVRVVRPTHEKREQGARTHTFRGRRLITADLKDPHGRQLVLDLVKEADVLIEGFRPGVTERLGIGPNDCLEVSPALIFARMTGWGQSGPWASTAGHDINFLSITGVLDAIGPKSLPVPPLNVVGDYGGGSLYLVTGILAGLIQRSKTGKGQVVDAAIVDGVSSLAQLVWQLRDSNEWQDSRSSNLLDGGSPFYRTYKCKDMRFVAVGAIEPHFYDAMLSGLTLKIEDIPDRNDQAQWPALTEVLARRFAGKTREEWGHIFAGKDACVTPVLNFEEARSNHQLVARRTLLHGEDRTEAAPAPRFLEPSLALGREAVLPDEIIASKRWSELLAEWQLP